MYHFVPIAFSGTISCGRGINAVLFIDCLVSGVTYAQASADDLGRVALSSCRLAHVGGDYRFELCLGGVRYDVRSFLRLAKSNRHTIEIYNAVGTRRWTARSGYAVNAHFAT